jgi:hypothetical protein
MLGPMPQIAREQPMVINKHLPLINLNGIQFNMNPDIQMAIVLY